MSFIARLLVIAILLFQGWKEGLALDLSGTTAGPFWATLISPTQYVSSAHYTAGAGNTYTFLSGDSADIVGYARRDSTDCVVGNLDQPVAGATYGFGLVTNRQPVVVVTRRGVITGAVTYVDFSSSNPQHEPYFTHSVMLQGGDSGAPTFDFSGNLVGTHHFTCGGNCGGDVLLGVVFGMQPPVASNVVNTVSASTQSRTNAPYVPMIRDVEMFLP